MSRKEYIKLEKLDMDSLTDEEVDEFYRPRSTNSQRSLAPLYVYLILSEEPNIRHTQAQIMKKLNEDYGVSIERKSLNRILHTLDDSGLGIVSTSDCGSWFEAA